MASKHHSTTIFFLPGHVAPPQRLSSAFRASSIRSYWTFGDSKVEELLLVTVGGGGGSWFCSGGIRVCICIALGW